MKYCSKCGSANSDDMAFCPCCGTSMEFAPFAPPAPTVSGASPSPGIPFPAIPPTEPPAAVESAPQPAKTNVSAVWMILNITATVLCCPGFLFTVPGIIFAALGSESFKNGNMRDASGKATASTVFFILGVLTGLAGWIGLIVIAMRRYY